MPRCSITGVFPHSTRWTTGRHLGEFFHEFFASNGRVTMSNTRVLIVEDNQEEAATTKAQLEELGFEVVAIANNLDDGLHQFYELQPDIALINIFLHGVPDGIHMAERITENRQTERPFIFMTQHDDEKVFKKAKSTAPSSYLLKPFKPLEMAYAIELALERHSEQKHQNEREQAANLSQKPSFFIKDRSSLIKVNKEGIEYIEVDGKYSQFITHNGKFLVQWSLKKLENILEPSTFFRVHRNYIINLEAIDRVNLKDHIVVLKSGKTIPIGYGFRDFVKASFLILK